MWLIWQGYLLVLIPEWFDIDFELWVFCEEAGDSMAKERCMVLASFGLGMIERRSSR